MSALSDFLTTATAPWWGAPVGAIVGAVSGQLVSSRSSRKSDQRKFGEERANTHTDRLDEARKERLDHARTIGVRLINGADDLVEALVVQHKHFVYLYNTMMANKDPIDFDSFKVNLDHITADRDSARKRLNILRVELEIVAPTLVEAARSFLDVTGSVGPQGDTETPSTEVTEDNYLSADWIDEPRRNYEAARESLVAALQRFVNAEE